MNGAVLFIERLWSDLRHGYRVFARPPGFVAIAVLSIACGTGANVAMFSAADALLLRPLPVPRPDELLVVGMRTDRGYAVTAGSYPDYVDIRDRARSFDGLLAYTLRWMGVSAQPGASAQVKVVQLVSANFFDVLQIRPALGRTFIAEDEQVPGRDAVAVLSHGRWRQQFGAELDAIGRDLARAHPATHRDQPLIAQTELEARFGDRLDAGLVLLLTILSAVVLAVACANVAGLLASRAPLRAREIALRLAVGASRGRLVRQLITESLLLALAGGVAGLAVGRAGILILQQMQYPSDTIQPPRMELDQRALLFSLAVAMGSAFLFGIGPALQTTRLDLARSIRTGDTAMRRRWFPTGRASLVAVQVALSLVLVTVAVFTLQMFRRVAATGPGFHVTQMAKVHVDTAHRQYSDEQTTALVESALDRRAGFRA